MNLAELQALEDRKTELKALIEKYGKIIEERKREFLKNAEEEFTKYFSENLFDIQSNGNGYHLAQYGEINVSLSLPNDTDSFIGAYSVLTLKARNEDFKVLVNRFGSYPRIGSTITSIPKYEDEKFQQEMDQTLIRIANAKSDIENFKNVTWGYGLKKEKENNLNYPQFETFTALLESLFN
jgi:hypothetical protein